MKAIKLFLTPEDVDDPVNKAKAYFLQTGMSVSLLIYGNTDADKNTLRGPVLQVHTLRNGRRHWAGGLLEGRKNGNGLYFESFGCLTQVLPFIWLAWTFVCPVLWGKERREVFPCLPSLKSCRRSFTSHRRTDGSRRSNQQSLQLTGVHLGIVSEELSRIPGSPLALDLMCVYSTDRRHTEEMRFWFWVCGRWAMASLSTCDFFFLL